MLRTIQVGIAVLTLAVSSTALASQPAVMGNVQGVELAQQTAFNPAIFAGVFSGRVGGRPALGVWAAGIEHETPLPEMPGESILITGGVWQMKVWVLQGFRLRSVALSGHISGNLAFFGPDLFSILATMDVTAGGTGVILLNAILDHTVFPPGVTGELGQP